MPIHISTAQPDFEIRFAGMLAMKREDATDVNDAVAAIIADVRSRGDAALVDLIRARALDWFGQDRGCDSHPGIVGEIAIPSGGRHLDRQVDPLAGRGDLEFEVATPI